MIELEGIAQFVAVNLGYATHVQSDSLGKTIVIKFANGHQLVVKDSEANRKALVNEMIVSNVFNSDKEKK